MGVVAVSNIQYGKDDGTVVNIGVGDTITGMSDDQVKSLVEGGSAIETGDNKKYTSPYYNAFGPVGGNPDEDTRKRDALIAGLLPAEERPAADGTAAAPKLLGQPTGVDIAEANRLKAEQEAAAKAAKATK